jgi:hypothetical protein
VDARSSPCMTDLYRQVMQMQSRGRAGGSLASSKHFCQAFPNLACFCPSFSKDFFGDFVGFQEVTRFPNLNVRLPNFLPFSIRCNSRRAPRPPRSQVSEDRRDGHGSTVPPLSFYRKENRQLPAKTATAQFSRRASSIHRASEIAELQDTLEFTFFSPCYRLPPYRQLGIEGRVTVIPP